MDVDCKFKETLDLLTLQNNSQDSELKQTQLLSNSVVKQIREQLEDLNHHDLPYGGDSYASYCIKETTKKVIKSYSYNDKSSISIDKSTVKLSVNPNTGQRQYKLSCKRKKITSSVYSTNSEIIGPIHSLSKGKDKYYQVHTVKSSISSYRVDKHSYNYRTVNEDLYIPTPCKYNMDRRSRSSRRDTVPITDSYYPFNEDYNNCAPCCAGAIPRLKPERSSIRIRGTFDVGNNDLYLFKCSTAAAKDNEEHKNDVQNLEDQNWKCKCDASTQPTRRSQGIQVSVRQSSLKSQPVQCDCKSITDLQQKYEHIKPNTLKVCESPLVVVSVYPNYSEKPQRPNFDSESKENKLNPVGESFGKKNFDDNSSSQSKKKSNVSSPRRKKQSRSSSSRATPSKRSKDNLRSPARNKVGKEVYTNSPKIGKSLGKSEKKEYVSGRTSKMSPRVKKNMGDSSPKKRKITKGTKAGFSKGNTSPLQKKQEYSQSATPSSRQDFRSGSRSPIQTPGRSISRESSKSRKSGSSLNNPYSFNKRDPCFRSVSNSASGQSTNEPLKAFLAQRKLNLESSTENPKSKTAPQVKLAAYKSESPKRNQLLSNQPPTPIHGGGSAKKYNQAYTCNGMPVTNQPNISRRLSSPQNRRKSNQSNLEYIKNKDPSQKNQTSNIHINIEGKNEKYDVSLHQGSLLNDVMILKQAKDQVKRKACRSGCPGTCNLKQAQNTFYKTTDCNMPQPLSSSIVQCDPGLSLVSEKDNKNSLHVALRQRRNITNDAKPSPKKKTKRDKKNSDLTPERHYRGDDCVTADVFDRDREIRMLLGVNMIRHSNSENFKERVAEFLNLSSVDCIYKNCFLINKSNSSCSIAQSNVLMRGDNIGNIVLNYENGLFRRIAMNRNLKMKNMVSDTIMSIKEHPYHNVYLEYKGSMQNENNEKKSLTKVTDKLCAMPSIVSCSLSIQHNSHQAENLIEVKKSLTINEQTFHDISSHITDKEQTDIFDERSDMLNNFEDSFWINKINDILINELAIYQDSANHPIDIKRPNEAFIQQLLFTTNKILKSRVSNLDPLTTDSNNVQFIYLGKTKSFTPDLGSSVLTFNSEFNNEDSGHRAPAKKIKKKFLKTLVSYLKKTLTNSKHALKGKTIEDSLNSYHINSVLGAMEMTSSIALYNGIGIKPSEKKSKRSFIGSVRGFITNWMRTRHSQL